MKKIIGVFGYGSQGRAQALNLRDSGNKVLIANINDKYSKRAIKDNFKIHSFKYVAKKSEIIFLLLPDHLHKKIYEEVIKKNLKEGSTIVIAHGYSLYFNEIKISKNFNWFLLAPRLPGPPQRKLYLENKKIPAVYSTIFLRKSNNIKILKKLAKDLKFILDKKMKTNFKEETELDLFLEQYVIPKIIFTFEESFNFLSKKGFNKKVMIMDLYGSGEVADQIYRASKIGLHQIWQNEASPTCRFGVMKSLEKFKRNKTKENHIMENVLKNIRNGNFNKKLKFEYESNLKNLKKFDIKNNSSVFYKTLISINKILK
jgi:ketol-acid reductoisomerase